MGANRAGENRKRRLRRHRKHQYLLLAWAKAVVAEYQVERTHIFATRYEDHVMFHPMEPYEQSVRIQLPTPMNFERAVEYACGTDEGNEQIRSLTQA